ncbi:MAG TPA: phage portal protein, partial [Candidatus Onthomonas avicola]|nr:phage portal protein [Candidatus Onthomonas avicola]
MPINFLRRLFGREKNNSASISAQNASLAECYDIIETAREYRVRELALQVCIDMIANAIGRCEFRTYQQNREVRDLEYYMLNIEPNVNQNSTAFWHQAIDSLVRKNEALIISTKTRGGHEGLVVADSWMEGPKYPARMREYTDVQVGDVSYQKTFREKDVLHLKLNNKNVVPVVSALNDSYSRLLESADRYFSWRNAPRAKVHINQIAQGQDGWVDQIQKNIDDRVKPFFSSSSAGAGVLPEFDGYDYQIIGGDAGGDPSAVSKLVEEIFNTTARALLIPAVLINGSIEGTADANNRFLTYVIDPICDQVQEELNRKRYGVTAWKQGN